MAPGLPVEIIGIRPGEKLHEVLITADESRHTIDAGDVYVVLPEHPWWTEHPRVGRRQAARRRLRLRERHQRRVARPRRARAVLDDLTALRMIPYGRQSIDEDDIAAVVDVLRGDWLTQGPAVERVRGSARARSPAPRHAVAFANGTAALHGACAAAGLGPGDVVGDLAAHVLGQRRTAPATSAPTPTLVDIDPATLNLDLAAVPAGLDALVAVHYAGLPVDLAALAAPARGSSSRTPPTPSARSRPTGPSATAPTATCAASRSTR